MWEPFDRKTYEAWKNSVVKQLPSRITCPDCNGSGDGICSHCGHEAECETCGGDGTVFPGVVLTPEFYRRAMVFEKARWEHWVNGDAIATKDEKGRWIERHNPLEELFDEYKPVESSPLSWPKAIVAIKVL